MSIERIRRDAIRFAAAFAPKEFTGMAGEQSWPHRSDLASALEWIDYLCKAIGEPLPRKPGHIGELIVAARQARGWSLADLATETGITKSHLWELESGRKCNPRLATMRAINQSLGLKPEHWFSNSDRAG